jgi:hypothetical protein
LRLLTLLPLKTICNYGLALAPDGQELRAASRRDASLPQQGQAAIGL